MAEPIKHHGKWRIRWVDEHGARRSEVYEDRRTAKAELARHEHEAHEIRNGLRAPTPPDKSFADLANYWLAHRTPLKRKAKDDRSIIARYLLPHLGALRLRALGVSHADALVAERLSHLNKKTVANILTLLISMLNAAVDLGWLLKVPRIRKPLIGGFLQPAGLCGDVRWRRSGQRRADLASSTRYSH